MRLARTTLAIGLLLGASACTTPADDAAPPGADPEADPQSEIRLPLGDSLALYVAAVPFDSTAHALTRVAGAGVRLIDGRPFFGSDGEAPWSSLESAELEVGGTRVPLDVSGMFNPWTDAPHAADFQTESSGGGVRVRGLFSDGAGAYAAEWLVLGGASVRTVLTNDERVMGPLLEEAPEDGSM